MCHSGLVLSQVTWVSRTLPFRFTAATDRGIGRLVSVFLAFLVDIGGGEQVWDEKEAILATGTIQNNIFI